MKKRILGILLCLIMAVGMLPTMAMAQENAPAFNLERDLEGITIPENLVIVTCETTEQSKNYGAISGGFDTDKAKPYLGDDGVWKVVVQLKLDVYKNQYDAETGTTHTVSGIGNTMISFTLEYVNKMWKVKGNFPSVPISVRCNNNHENQTPNLPMYPTIDNISGLNDKIVAVLCANTQEGQEAGKYYGLLDGGFTSTKPELNDGMFESTHTLIPSVYCKQYSTDTGITHRVNPNQTTEGLTFVVEYDEAEKMWRPKEEVRSMGIWVYCEKHETQPQPPVIPVYPPSGGGSTIYPGGTPGGNGTIVNPDNNQGNQQPTVDSKDKQGNNKTKKIKKSDTMEKVPKTGDNTAMTIWLVLLLLSVGALFGTVAFDRKRKRI